MRRFYLQRNRDISGVSGLGKVAEGCQHDNGWCSLTWLTTESDDDIVVNWYCSIRRLVAVHGHDGATQVIWIDDESSNVIVKHVRCTKSAVYCEHANECPQRCPCTFDCYCKEHTCKPR